MPNLMFSVTLEKAVINVYDDYTTSSSFGGKVEWFDWKVEDGQVFVKAKVVTDLGEYSNWEPDISEVSEAYEEWLVNHIIVSE